MITGVATSITAFVGSAARGPIDLAIRVQSFAEFERIFGGLSRSSPMSYAVSQFFQNGGADALVVRVAASTAAAATGAAGTLKLKASSPGAWGGRLRIRVDHKTRAMVGNEALFNLTVRDTAPLGTTERFLDVSARPTHQRYVGTVLERESALVRLVRVGARRPAKTPEPATPGTDPMTVTPGSIAFNADGDDGTAITDAEISAPVLEPPKRGIWALERESLFNLLCIPPLSFGRDVGAQTRAAAAAYCTKRRAFFISDPLAEWVEPSDLITGAASLEGPDWGLAQTESAAVYFPRILAPDPLQEGQLAEFAPSGAVAGAYARMDAARGVWKAPAGSEATLHGVSGLSATLTDRENGPLNRLGVNCLRAFPGMGHVIWGARTLCGADSLASEWKYVPVRRLALYIEESVYRGTQWVVFEPNDEPLWSRILLNVGAFMQTLFRQGAFAGASPRDAYFVKCDRETTTQADIERGVVNMLVGIAPLKPTEFVVIRLQQTAGQVVA